MIGLCPYCGRCPEHYIRDAWPRHMMGCDMAVRLDPRCDKMYVRSDSIIKVRDKWERKVKKTKAKLRKKELKTKSFKEKHEWKKLGAEVTKNTIYVKTEGKP